MLATQPPCSPCATALLPRKMNLPPYVHRRLCHPCKRGPVAIALELVTPTATYPERSGDEGGTVFTDDAATDAM